MFTDLNDVYLTVRSLAGTRAKNAGAMCPLTFRQGRHGTDAIAACARCALGSSLSDAGCRQRLARSLAGKSRMDRLLLEKDLVREYGGDALGPLMSLVAFYEDARLHASTLRAAGCGKCDLLRAGQVAGAIDRAIEAPWDALPIVASVPARTGKGDAECGPCTRRYAVFLGDLAEIARRLAFEDTVPYVRPGFSSSRIRMEPPEGAAFLRSYEVAGDAFAPPLHVTLYGLPESPEKMYFIVPWEYAMEAEDVALLAEARRRLVAKRPGTLEFMDAANMRPTFTRYGKEALAHAAEAGRIRLETSRLERLTSALVKYTCGLGILEDVLRDPHIEDAYVNAPVGDLPLHVVVDGEECTSNVFLSEADVESTISRLRALSGRPFSEASPVLDMDLGEFRTRVSAIGDPLSRGLAYAFRRHKATPWTLPQLVSRKMLTPYAAGLLSLLVDGQSSMLVTGTRGAGKTSLLGALMLEIPQSYRILAIEDTPELPLEDMQRTGWKVQGMGTRAAVSGSGAEFQAADALRAALRMGESALVIGEVRGAEARALYEAMRIGASGNVVMGTIHGATCEDVYDRVVHDIGVPPASFKATDVVVVCSTVRPGGGHARERRLTQVAEVSRSRWDEAGGAFDDLMAYDPATGGLHASDRIDTGRSEALRSIAGRWGVSIRAINREIEARAGFMERLAAAPDAAEAAAYARCANAYRAMREKSPAGTGQAAAAWSRWFGEADAGGR